MIFEFREGYRPQSRDVDPQVVGSVIEELRKEHGLVTPELVLETARPKASPIHNAFEWDTKVAAEKYRLAQAGYLIRAVYAVPTQDEFKSLTTADRAFYYVKPTPTTEGYTSQFVAMSDDVLRKQVLDRALAELRTWQAKYKHLRELEELFLVIDNFSPEKVLVA